MALFPYLAFNRFLAARGAQPQYVIGLDSATLELEGTAQYLKGQDLAAGGMLPHSMAWFAGLSSKLPKEINDTITGYFGWLDASSPAMLKRIRAETLSQWAVNRYPQKQYPAVMIGSSNGAIVHLCAALGIPWLPQTLLACARHTGDKDDPQQALIWAKDQLPALLEANPNLSVYQMHDPNQDRLKVGRVAYFRLKQTRLSQHYRQFLQQNLEPGGTIFLLECQYSWPATRVSDRHYFQVGGRGGIPPENYLQGSPLITHFLKQQGSSHRQWNCPPSNGYWAEAEWGFDDALRDDVFAFAREHDLNVRRIVFDKPQDMSPLVADLYREWYQERGMAGDRLLVESFSHVQPWWTLRLGLVPYWTAFNDITSLEWLKQYLEKTQPYDEIYLTLFSNGLNSLGIASIEQWRSEILSLARKKGCFLGVDERYYPRDNASFVRHYLDLKQLPGRVPLPTALNLHQLDEFLKRKGDRYAVQWS